MAAPDGLSDAAQRVFDGVVRDWELDERELATLTRACVQLTIAERLEHAVARDGETVVGSRGQPRVHPAIAEARQCAEAGVRMLARLELRDEVPLPESERARKAAHARWENARRRAASGL